MRLTKLFLIFVSACSLQLAACSLVLASGEDVTVNGDTRSASLGLEPKNTMPSGSEGEVVYNDSTPLYSANTVYFFDGTNWNTPSGGDHDVATIVIGTTNPAGPSLESARADVGYLCNGTNDQVKINQAITDIADISKNPSGKGIIYLLEGTYNISSSINMQSNIALIGTGNATVFNSAISDGTIPLISASNASGLLISSLRINGAATNSSGIRFTTVTNSKIDKLSIENFNGSGSTSAFLIRLETDSNYNAVTNSVFQSNATNNAIYIYGSDHNLVSRNKFKSNTFTYSDGITPQECINVTNTKSSGTRNGRGNMITDNILESNFGGRIVLASTFSGGASYYAGNNIVSGNYIYNSRWGLPLGSQDAQGAIQLSRASNNTISGNVLVTSDTGDGVGLYSASMWNVISNNIISLSGRHGIAAYISAGYNIISGNLISDSAGDGIRLISGDDEYLIFGNRLINDGINIAASNCDNNYLVGNMMDGAISDSGTKTKYTGKEKITLEQITATAPTIRSDRSYVKTFSAAGVTPLANGKAAGDILILQGPDGAGGVTPSGSIKFRVPGGYTLYSNDTLTLIWDGTYWLELSYSNN